MKCVDSILDLLEGREGEPINNGALRDKRLEEMQQVLALVFVHVVKVPTYQVVIHEVKQDHQPAHSQSVVQS